MQLEMTDDEFRLFQALIHRECGLYFGQQKKGYLSSRIARRVALKSMRSFYRYYRYLQEPGVEQKAELLLLLDLLTINETSFFRNRPQFQLLEQHVLPERIAARADSRRLRIWSAGCSTGEEPYSIAISVLETLPRSVEWKVEIFASDLSLSVLEKAECGVYPAHRLEEVEPERLERYFERCPEGFVVRREVKRIVIYDFHNLMNENGLSDLDVVFCRNVLIYFDAEEQRRVLDRIVRKLNPGGYLFLGHSESVLGLMDNLQFVHRDKGTAYRKAAA